MILDIRTQDGASVAVLPPRLDSTNAWQVEAELPPLFTAGLPLVFDAGPCGYISSAGLRLLLVCAKRCAGSGGKVAIAAMAPPLKDVMRITGFDHLFTFHPDVATALLAQAGSGTGA